MEQMTAIRGDFYFWGLEGWVKKVKRLKKLLDIHTDDRMVITTGKGMINGDRRKLDSGW